MKKILKVLAVMLALCLMISICACKDDAYDNDQNTVVGDTEDQNDEQNNNQNDGQNDNDQDDGQNDNDQNDETQNNNQNDENQNGGPNNSGDDEDDRWGELNPL